MMKPTLGLVFVVLTGCGSSSGIIAERTSHTNEQGSERVAPRDAGGGALEAVVDAGNPPTSANAPSPAPDEGATLSDSGAAELDPSNIEAFSYPAPCEAVIESDVLDVRLSQLRYDASCERVQLTVATTAAIGASSTQHGALILDVPVPVSLIVRGAVIGAGGDGGSGGNGGSGSPYCGRDGLPGGPAIVLQTHATVVVEEGGLIAGGGGGGGGFSGGNEAGGGGGGGGYVAGRGGAGATSLSEAEEYAYCGQDNGYRTGKQGNDAKGTTPGSGVGSSFPLDLESCPGSGAGGRLGQPGEGGECYGSSQGGAPGAAIERGRFTAGVPDGNYTELDGPIRGPVRE